MKSSIPCPSSICILRLSAIGDVCHAVATVQGIQRQWPQAKITWIIGSVEARLLKHLQNVELVVFDKKAGIKGYTDLYRNLSGRRFDVLLHMQVALRASLATLCIRAKEKWGFDSSRAKEGQWLFTNRQIAPHNHPHVADGFWNFAQAIGVDKNEKPSWLMPVSQEDKEWCRSLFQNQRYIVISPSASKAERNWTVEGYAEIAEFAKTQDLLVVLSGGPSKMELELGQQIESLSGAVITNMIGKTNLPQLLALLDNAALVIAPDSGPAHMASSLNTPVVGLYAHSNPKRTGPYNSQETVVSVYPELLLEQTGKTVEQNTWGKRVKGENLMQRISIESVINATKRALSTNESNN